MSLRVKPQAEPFTEYSKTAIPILAECEEYRRLSRDLARYTSGLIAGRSYLIAGHRGSGKTMLIHKAIEDLLRQNITATERPLFVRVHGPDLLPPIVEQSEKEKPAEAAPPAASNQIAIAVSSPASVTSSPQSAERSKADEEMVNVLTQMMKCLFRDVSNEFRRCFREVILNTADGPRRREKLELIAQLDLELAEGITTARLRNYWQRIGTLADGVLFRPPRRSYQRFSNVPEPPATPLPTLQSTDIGLQEILVLSFLSQAFQVISGKIEEKQKQTDAAKQEQSSSLNTAYALKNLLSPFVGLASAGIVSALLLSGGPVTAILMGLLTGTLVSIGFSYTSTRSRNREMSLESVFIKDRSIPTLSSVLPLLVMRLKQIGLAPIFVVDELDKVDKLEDRMRRLVQHMKYLVTENSFTCFLTDRRYLTYLNNQANQTAYAAEYTYFSERLLVLYKPLELREYIFKALEPDPDSYKGIDPSRLSTQQHADAVERDQIAWTLLHRSRMHPIDLRRQIDQLAARESITLKNSFNDPGFRFEILMQVAIEWMLDGDDMKLQLAENPHSRQVVYDALYYVSRLWKEASVDDTGLPGMNRLVQVDGQNKSGFNLTKEDFSRYIESRCANEATGTPKNVPADSNAGSRTSQPQIKQLSGSDFDFLFIKVQQLLSLISDPTGFFTEINRSQREKPPVHILNSLPDRGVIERVPKTQSYVWLYDVSGRYLQTRDATKVKAEVNDSLRYLNFVSSSLESLGSAIGSLQKMAELHIIPMTPQWLDVQPALRRLEVMSSAHKEESYPEMVPDRDVVIEFNGTLESFESNLTKALVCAYTLLSEVKVPTSGTEATTRDIKLMRALSLISEFLQLSASKDEDSRKLTSVLKSDYVKATASGLKALKQVTKALADTAVAPPALFSAPIIDSAWQLTKARFSKRFRDGSAPFSPEFPELYAYVTDSGPGKVLTSDLSIITAEGWTQVLLLALARYPEDLKTPETAVPSAWVAVAAAIELGLLDLANTLANRINDPEASQWVRDAQLRSSAQTIRRRNALVLTAETDSLTKNWKTAVRHGAIVLTSEEFVRNKALIKRDDFGINFICLELVGKPDVVTKLVQQPGGLSEVLSKNHFGSHLFNLVGVPLVLYFRHVVSVIDPPGQPFVSAPKDLDDLIERTPESQALPPS